MLIAQAHACEVQGKAIKNFQPPQDAIPGFLLAGQLEKLCSIYGILSVSHIKLPIEMHCVKRQAIGIHTIHIEKLIVRYQDQGIYHAALET